MAQTNLDRKADESASALWGNPGRNTLHIAVKGSLDLPDVMTRQLNKVRMKSFTPLGTLKRVLFEQVSDEALAARDNRLVGNKNECLQLDWLNIGPMMGLGADGEDILFAESLPVPPLVTDPGWKAEPVLSRDMIVGLHDQGKTLGTIAVELGASVDRVEEAYNLPKGDTLWPTPPKVEQTVWHRSLGPVEIGGAIWESFGPVIQIEIASLSKQGFIYVNARGPDSRDRHMELIWHPETHRAHFVFGSYEVDMREATKWAP